MEKSKKCGYTYKALDHIGIAVAAALKGKNSFDLEQIQMMLSFYRGVLNICETNPSKAKALLKIGREAMEKSEGK